MKTDISKLSFDELKHYLGVSLQMGRVQLDADWNEQSEIWLRLLQRHAADAAGVGSPNQGFRVDDRILLDSMDSRSGWAAEKAGGDPDPLLFVDYFAHRTGAGSLSVEGAVAVVRTLPTAADWTGLTEVVFAVQEDVPASACTFFLDDGGGRRSLTTTRDAAPLGGWYLFRADPASLPASFDLASVTAYGFRNLDKSRRYHFDFIKGDLPILGLLVPTTRAGAFTATELAPGDVARVSIQDDDRIWKSTVLLVEKAATVQHELPAPRDLSHARSLRFAARSPTAGAGSVTLKLIDADGHEQTVGSVTLSSADAWVEGSFAVPSGSLDLTRITKVEWLGLTADGYLLSPVVLALELDDNLVIHGGDGSAEGAGRFYGDGLAAVKESHETYFSQADLPAADAAPLAAPAAGKHRVDLAYLDLWERPVTYLEEPEIREVALEGPDTCTRTRLVAQVRILKGEEVTLAGTATPPDAVFSGLPRCGGGTLTTKDKPAAVLDPCADPCEPEITGPYVGQENRLYRVEVHTCGDVGPEGAAGTATFKWSRENGAVATALTADAAVGATSVTVEKPELFAVGDLIEISDDLVDLITGPYEDTAGHRCHERGELRQITAVNLESRLLSWDDPTAADPTWHLPLVHAFHAVHHAKIRRWDGLLAATPGDIVLDDGVVIELGGAKMVPGDYWVFTTRTADGSVERLVEAPPRGICHRTFKLATLHRKNEAGSESTLIEDCRPFFHPLTELEATDVAFDPGRCADKDAEWAAVENVQEAIELLCQRLGHGGLCSATVGDGVVSHGDYTSIQSAIDSLDGRGGMVCILPGHHRVESPIQVPSNVVLRGAGPATRIAYVPQDTENPGDLFTVGKDARRVAFVDFFAATTAGDSLIQVEGAREVLLAGCTLANTRVAPLASITDSEEVIPSAVALGGACSRVRVEGCRLVATIAVHGETKVRELTLRDTVMRAPLADLWFSNLTGLEASACDLAGVAPAALSQLLGLTLDGGGGSELLGTQMEAFQKATAEAVAKSDGFALVGYGALVASRVDLEGCRFNALIGALPLLGSFHAFWDCDFGGLFNLLLPFSLFFKVEDCRFVGLANVIQGGLALELDFRGNYLAGVWGFLVGSLSFFLVAVLVALATATGGLPGLVASLYQGFAWLAAGQAVAKKQVGKLGGLLALGVAAQLTLRENRFLCWLTGFHKDASALTADVTLTDNRFHVCGSHGVFLAAGNSQMDFLANAFSPNHDLQRNHFQIQGTAVESHLDFTRADHNHIRCEGPAAIRLAADRCRAEGNRITLSENQKGTQPAGLHLATGSALAVRSNRITGGKGCGILLAGVLADVILEGNQIEGANLNGISAAGPAVATHRLVVRGNRVTGCVLQGGTTYPLWQRGGIVLADGTRVTVSDNQVWANGKGATRAVHGIYLEDLEDAVISDNEVWDNGGSESESRVWSGSGLTVWKARRDVQILGNSLTNNRGYGLRVAEASGYFFYDPGTVGSLLVKASWLFAAMDAQATAAGTRGAARSGPGAESPLAGQDTVAAANPNLYNYNYTYSAGVFLDLADYFVGYVDQASFQSVTVAGNTITGRIRQALVDVDDVERLLFNDNRVSASKQSGDVVVTPVQISANHLVFTGNHVAAPVGGGKSVQVVQLGSAPKAILSNNILQGSIGQLPGSSSNKVINIHNLYF